VNDGVQQQAERIYENMAFLPLDFLTRIIARGSMQAPLVWGLFCQAVFERRIFLDRFLCSAWSPRRAQELSRLAVAPTLRHALVLPGHTLTASSTTARFVRSG
jgi:hypothetical protein